MTGIRKTGLVLGALAALAWGADTILLPEPAAAAKGDSFSSKDAVAAQVATILNAQDRLPMPLQNVRKNWSCDLQQKKAHILTVYSI